VVAWDDNELRGTLGLRAGSARHAKTIRHLVTELSEVELYTGAALTERLDDFLRHASDGSYDVLPARRTRGSRGGSTRPPCAGCSTC
jgi:hypothetical protein